MIILLVALLIILVLLRGFRIVKEWEKLPVLRLGRYVGLRGPGITYLIPIIDSVPERVSTRLQTVGFRTEQTLTADNVPVNLDGVMYARVVDIDKAILNVEDYNDATEWAAQTTLREVIGKVELNELLAEREEVGIHLREIIDEKTEAWGIKVTSVEVKDVIIPSVLQDSMSRQAQAERERMARVTLATAELQAASKILEAAEVYGENKEAFSLRWMNILYEMGQQQGTNTIMLVPSNLPTAGLPPVGLVSIKEASKANQRE